MKNNALWVALAIVAFWLQGCYVLEQAGGQLRLQWRKQPIDQAIQTIDDPEKKRLLAEVPRIKAYAVDQLHLQPTDSYTDYYATDQKGVAFVVTAAPKDALQPVTWWFPIVGSVPYKGYFDRADAEALERELQRQNNDTWLFAAPAYSTLGWFDDPVTTPMLRKGLYSLTETIIHEMTHETLYVKHQGHFNEQLASFVGERGAMAYLKGSALVTSEELETIRQRRARYQRIALTVKRTIPELKDLYDQALPLSEVLAKRQRIFDDLTAELVKLAPGTSAERWRFNNARILQYERYEAESELMRRLWKESGGDWDRFWQAVRSHVAQKNW